MQPCTEVVPHDVLQAFSCSAKFQEEGTVNLVQHGQYPNKEKKEKELHETKLLLHEWDHLSVDKDGC